MKYIKVIWNHEFEDEPVELYSELDDYNNEIRKIEIYRNGNVGYATLEESYNKTFLSKQELPDISEINKDNQFYAIAITENEFSKIWYSVIDKSLF